MQKKVFGIGIDIGTTKCRIGVWMNNQFQLIQNEEGLDHTPTYIAFTEDQILVGEPAKNQAARNPQNTIFDINRFLGKKFNDPQIQQNLKYWPFQLEMGPQDRIIVVIKYKQGTIKKYYPEHLLAIILKKIKLQARRYLKQEIKQAVVTVGLQLDILQRQSIYKSMQLADLQCIRIMSGLICSSISLILQQKIENDFNVIAISLGGGSFNVSILEFENPVIEQKAMSGNDYLGGQDFDNKLLEYCCAKFKKQVGFYTRNNPSSISRLKNQCEKAKFQLSCANQAQIEVDCLFEQQDFRTSINRKEFNEMCEPLFDGIDTEINKVLYEEGLQNKDIKEIFVFGGSERIQYFYQYLKDQFPFAIFRNPNCDYLEVQGAAFQHALLSGSNDSLIRDWLTMNAVRFPLGIETEGGLMYAIIQKNTTNPTKKCIKITTTTDYQKGILIKIYQGLGKLTKDCIKCGEFILEGLESAKKGVPVIELTADIDENDVITFKAEDQKTKSSNQITLSLEQDIYFQSEIGIFNEEGLNIKLCNE